MGRACVLPSDGPPPGPTVCSGGRAGWRRGASLGVRLAQEDLYRKTIAMLRKIPAWRGVTPWILADFRSPRRVLPNMQDGWNRKGLIGQNGTRKRAFAVLKSFYDELEQRATRGK